MEYVCLGAIALLLGLGGYQALARSTTGSQAMAATSLWCWVSGGQCDARQARVPARLGRDVRLVPGPSSEVRRVLTVEQQRAHLGLSDVEIAHRGQGHKPANQMYTATGALPSPGTTGSPVTADPRADPRRGRPGWRNAPPRNLPPGVDPSPQNPSTLGAVVGFGARLFGLTAGFYFNNSMWGSTSSVQEWRDDQHGEFTYSSSERDVVMTRLRAKGGEGETPEDRYYEGVPEPVPGRPGVVRYVAPGYRLPDGTFVEEPTTLTYRDKWRSRWVTPQQFDNPEPDHREVDLRWANGDWLLMQWSGNGRMTIKTRVDGEEQTQTAWAWIEGWAKRGVMLEARTPDGRVVARSPLPGGEWAFKLEALPEGLRRRLTEVEVGGWVDPLEPPETPEDQDAPDGGSWIAPPYVWNEPPGDGEGEPDSDGEEHGDPREPAEVEIPDGLQVGAPVTETVEVDGMEDVHPDGSIWFTPAAEGELAIALEPGQRVVEFEGTRIVVDEAGNLVRVLETTKLSPADENAVRASADGQGQPEASPDVPPINEKAFEEGDVEDRQLLPEVIRMLSQWPNAGAEERAAMEARIIEIFGLFGVTVEVVDGLGPVRFKVTQVSATSRFHDFFQWYQAKAGGHALLLTTAMVKGLVPQANLVVSGQGVALPLIAVLNMSVGMADAVETVAKALAFGVAHLPGTQNAPSPLTLQLTVQYPNATAVQRIRFTDLLVQLALQQYHGQNHSTATQRQAGLLSQQVVPLGGWASTRPGAPANARTQGLMGKSGDGKNYVADALSKFLPDIIAATGGVVGQWDPSQGSFPIQRNVRGTQTTTNGSVLNALQLSVTSVRAAPGPMGSTTSVDFDVTVGTSTVTARLVVPSVGMSPDAIREYLRDVLNEALTVARSISGH